MQARGGIFERPKRSGIWWIDYRDGAGLRHREKIGRRAEAGKAYDCRVKEVAARRRGQDGDERRNHMNTNVLAGFFFIGISLVAYFMPAMVAKGRRHKNFEAIFVLNFLAGWTVVGWIVAIVWASNSSVHPAKPYYFPAPQDQAR